MPAKKPTNKTESKETAPAKAAETAIKPARKRAAAPKSSAATHKQAAPRASAARTRKLTAARPAFDASVHQDEIAREAYYLWESRGYTHGHEGEDWFRALEIVRARYE